MNLRHAAALALVGWYLMMPPPDNVGSLRRFWEGSLAGWSIKSSFDSSKECESARQKELADAHASIPREGELADNGVITDKGVFIPLTLLCIATDDPRLKGN
jgi:hypothetical protein